MSAIDYAGAGILAAMFTPCHRLERVTADEKGLMGPKESWAQGAALDAMLRKDSSAEAQTAEQRGMAAMYTVIVQRGIALKHGDVLRRDGDGLTLRVTGTTVDGEAPDTSTIQIAKVSAERWDPPQ